MRPSLGSYRRAISLVSVVLPAPFSPTSATRSPGRSEKLTWRTAHRSLPGYLKPTSSNTKPSRIGRGTGRAFARAVDRRLHVEEREQVLEIEALLIDAARRHQQTLNQVAALAKRRREKGQHADRDRAGRPRAARTTTYARVVAEGADDRQRGAHERLAHRQCAVLVVEPVGQRAVARDQPRARGRTSCTSFAVWSLAPT